MKYIIDTPKGKVSVQIVKRGDNWYVRRLNYSQYEKKRQVTDRVREVMREVHRQSGGRAKRDDYTKAVKEAFRNYEKKEKKGRME